MAVKLSGKTLVTVIALKHKLEEDKGGVVSVIEVIREAVKVMAKNRNVYVKEE